MRRKFPAKNVVYALFIVIPFGLIFFNSPFWHNVKMDLMQVVTFSVSIVRWPIVEAEKVISYRKTWAENKRLKSEMNALKARAIHLEEALRKATRYAKLNEFRDEQLLKDTVRSAVIARSPTNWNSSLMINVGEKDRIKPGMAVVNEDGVVGKVAEVAGNVSKVILVNDPGFSVAGVDRRSRESGLISGTLSGACRMYYLPDEADIEVGDEVITSGLSREFPPGVLIGEVALVSRSARGDLIQVQITPAVQVSKIEEVLVVR